MKKKSIKEKILNHHFFPYLITFFFLIGFLLGILFRVIFPYNDDTPYTQIRESGYEFINPLVDFETVESTKEKDLGKLNKYLNNYVEEKTKYKSKTNIHEISIYYKDLNSGGWIGINESIKFSPASLLKIPIMISFYKEAEHNPEILNDKIFIELDMINKVEQNIPPEKRLEYLKEYTIEELIEQMIIYSDNDALYALDTQLNTEALDKTYSDLGAPQATDKTSENFMTVKEYATFFRILYNASYLNKDMSMKALRLLSQTSYNSALEEGIPDDIVVANKFGERLIKSSGLKQLHDCGIVYHPTKPYLLCVMTRGTEFKKLEETIQIISKTVYNSVNK
jgi:beta-lactamase class A